MRTLVAALLLTLVLGGTAAAGGWAVTTLDPLPDIHAGQPYTIGWTIRQHGQTPIDVERLGGTTEIQATTPDGSRTLTFPGKRDGGPTGHYAATIQLPVEGTWTWQVTQGPFQAQPLGTLPVLAATAPVQQTPDGGRPAGLDPRLIAGLVLALSGAAMLLASRLGVRVTRAAHA